MIDRETAAELDKLAERIARMRPPMNSNPHAFHEDRSELASEVRKIATRLRSGVRPSTADDSPSPAKPARIVRHETRHIGGRTVHVLKRERAYEHDWVRRA